METFTLTPREKYRYSKASKTGSGTILSCTLIIKYAVCQKGENLRISRGDIVKHDDILTYLNSEENKTGFYEKN